jgi:hypothetical protein
MEVMLEPWAEIQEVLPAQIIEISGDFSSDFQELGITVTVY